jgi:hypothetical protein
LEGILVVTEFLELVCPDVGVVFVSVGHALAGMIDLARATGLT